MRIRVLWHTTQVTDADAPSETNSTADQDQTQAHTRPLLHGPTIPADPRPNSRWAYPLVGIVIVSAFILYHTTVLLTWNVPSKGLAAKAQKTILDKVDGRNYMRAAGSTQSWRMFAPNPNRTNTFIRVLVTDLDGEEWDLKHDIYKLNRYPYIMYSRRGKINRRLDDKKGYQREYAAWVCREWEREHGGTPAKSVRFVKRWTVVPRPWKLRDKWDWSKPFAFLNWGYYNPWKLKSWQREQEKFYCKSTTFAQNPPHLRAEYGLEGEPVNPYKPGIIRTWWDKAEDERKREERKKEREEKKKAREEKRKSEQANDSEDSKEDPKEATLQIDPELDAEEDGRGAEDAM